MKKNVYLWLFVVLVVWGFVIYRFLNLKNQDDDNVFIYQKSAISDSVKIEKDSWKLKANYRDPFLGSVYIKTVEKKNQNPVKKEIKKPEIPVSTLPVIWPRIEYKGFVSSNDRTLGILVINSKQYIFSKKDSISGVHVKCFYPDSAQLIFRSENKTFKKSK